MKQSIYKAGLGVLLIVCGLFVVSAAAAQEPQEAPSFRAPLFNTTQGPLWPPSSITNEDGDFIVIGTLLGEAPDGSVFPIFNGAALVSKETVPPLNENGVEDFSNLFGAPYRVIRPLDLRRRGGDLDMVLYSNSFGPPQGNFGGGPRTPMEGESTYNLNGGGPFCPELFPASSQAATFTVPRFPLHEVPILGLKGDQVRYNVDTGLAEPSPELRVDEKPQKNPITLGQWLQASGDVKVTLVDYNEEVEAYTAARFTITLRGMLPNAMYTVFLLRSGVLQGRPGQFPDPLAGPSLIITNDRGRGELSRVVPNPFPDPAVDEAGLRVEGLILGYRSSYMNWGACTVNLGAGVNSQAVLGNHNLPDLTTRAAP